MAPTFTWTRRGAHPGDEDKAPLLGNDVDGKYTKAPAPRAALPPGSFATSVASSVPPTYPVGEAVSALPRAHRISVIFKREPLTYWGVLPLIASFLLSIAAGTIGVVMLGSGEWYYGATFAVGSFMATFVLLVTFGTYLTIRSPMMLNTLITAMLLLFATVDAIACGIVVVLLGTQTAAFQSHTALVASGLSVFVVEKFLGLVGVAMALTHSPTLKHD